MVMVFFRGTGEWRRGGAKKRRGEDNRVPRGDMAEWPHSPFFPSPRFLLFPPHLLSPRPPRSPLIPPALPSSPPRSPHPPRAPLIPPALSSSPPLSPQPPRAPLILPALSSSSHAPPSRSPCLPHMSEASACPASLAPSSPAPTSHPFFPQPSFPPLAPNTHTILATLSIHPALFPPARSSSFPLLTPHFRPPTHH
ncbi:unnamed protein product [Closterium sp. NIES-65]|nr:unnamed protein product [Closterium sp. NIES-65]